MQPAQPVVLRVDLAEFADGRVEVVGFHRQIVRVAGGLRFLERGEFAVGILAAVIHVITHQRAAAAELAQRHGLDIARIIIHAAVIRGRHPAADFAGEIWIFFRAGSVAGFAAAQRVIAHAGVGAGEFECEIFPTVAVHRLGVALPKTVRVGAEERQQFAERHGGCHCRPAGFDVERHVNAGFNRDFFQGQQIVRRAAKLIVHLDADDRAAVLPQFALELLGDFAIKNLHRRKKIGVRRAQFPVLVRDDPVGKTAVADFAMAPRAATDDDFQAEIVARLEKLFQVALAGPIPLAFDFLMMNPENVGRHDVHAAGLHLEQFVAPLGLRHARVVHFAHHGKNRPVVEQQAAAVQGDRVAGGICGGAEFKIARFGGRRRLDRGRNDFGAE